MSFSLSRRASLVRSFVFLAMGILWLGMMYLIINGFVWAFSDIKLSEIMSTTGDIATVFAFSMVYMRNSFINSFSLDVEKQREKISFWGETKKRFRIFLYDAFSYLLAWHAVVAVLLRSDRLNNIIADMTTGLLTFAIIISFVATAWLLLKGYKEGSAEEEN
ncbi:hypothetical protein KMP13_10550 [Epibacterium ulvae]|uniref:hypothetical protein n=1 Tax=Epibacterium ulvae TaxID=1156985 RepID=UPI001BFCBEC3|nr:hypothetical protein [Epibacterium ulvae]MBT8154329.1 hypothetical protein [Epibacterium ulvae]